MADKDFTRDAVERATKMTTLGLERLQLLIPFGPNSVQMTDSEIQQNLRRPNADKIATFIDLIGQEETMEILQRNRDGA